MPPEAKFAAGTTTSTEKTFSEIRALLKRYEATNFAMIENAQHFGIAFEYRNRRVRFIVPLPDTSEAHVTKGNQYRRYDGGYSEVKHEQLIRERWRAAFLVIKAKLESVASGIETFDEAFMGQLVLPDGHTMTEVITPYLDGAYANGEMPPLLGDGK